MNILILYNKPLLYANSELNKDNFFLSNTANTI